MSKLQNDDLVQLKPLRVQWLTGAGPHVRLGGKNVFIYDEDVEKILPRPPEVDDTVLIVVGGPEFPSHIYGEILAINGESAWVNS